VQVRQDDGIKGRSFVLCFTFLRYPPSNSLFKPHGNALLSTIKMKSVLALLFASLAIAAPTVDRRDTYYVANDVEQLSGTCTAPVIFIFARGSTEVSNLVCSLAHILVV
jgi:hypothetical protein